MAPYYDLEGNVIPKESPNKAYEEPLQYVIICPQMTSGDRLVFKSIYTDGKIKQPTYVTDLRQASKFTKKQAYEECNSDKLELPYPAKLLESIAERTVRIQRMPAFWYLADKELPDAKA